MNLKGYLKKTVLYHPLRWVYHLPRRVYFALHYRMVESCHRFSAAWSCRRGVTDEKREPELIVSLTTIPERIDTIHLCLDSLLRQSLKPDRIILWLSESNEPGRPMISAGQLPAALTRLVERGLEIHWCKDTRSFRKIIPTLRAYPQALIVTADDDIFYPRHWLRLLYEAYQNEPHFMHCHRAHLIKYDHNGVILPYRQWDFLAPGHQGSSLDLFPTSGGGVLYAPGHLHPEVLNEKVFLELCPKADDVWLKAMSLMAHVPCKKVSSNTIKYTEIKISNNLCLCTENVDQGGNDQQTKAVGQKYGIYAGIDKGQKDSTKKEPGEFQANEGSSLYLTQTNNSLI